MPDGAEIIGARRGFQGCRMTSGTPIDPARMQPAAAKPGRDVRLDFFRGLAMFIIFVAHMPGNSWFNFIPARFGFSSAGELFVFCSGLASAFAFGRVFDNEGWLQGTRRILYRIWQVYWAHIGLALGLIVISVAALDLTGIDYPEKLGLAWLFANPGDGLLRLMTLRLSPAFLDILPMYLVLLAMLPAMMLPFLVLPAKFSRLLPLAAIAALWIGVQVWGINLPGGQMPGMVWFFNPFAWQAVFFTGFAFGMGWLPVPRLERSALFWFCTALLILSVPVNFWAFTETWPVLADLHTWFVPEDGKTNLALPLYVHFLASAYVALVLVEPVRDRLAAFRPIILVGQQALATFMASILLAWTGGMVLDAFGRNEPVIALVNLGGFAGLIGVAMIARGYKRGKKSPEIVKTPAPAGQRDGAIVQAPGHTRFGPIPGPAGSPHPAE